MQFLHSQNPDVRITKLLSMKNATSNMTLIYIYSKIRIAHLTPMASKHAGEDTSYYEGYIRNMIHVMNSHIPEIWGSLLVSIKSPQSL